MLARSIKYKSKEVRSIKDLKCLHVSRGGWGLRICTATIPSAMCYNPICSSLGWRRPSPRWGQSGCTAWTRWTRPQYNPSLECTESPSSPPTAAGQLWSSFCHKGRQLIILLTGASGYPKHTNIETFVHLYGQRTLDMGQRCSSSTEEGRRGREVAGI